MSPHHHRQIRRKVDRQLYGDHLWLHRIFVKQKYLSPIHRLLRPSNEIKVLPMDGPVGQVFYLNNLNHA